MASRNRRDRRALARDAEKLAENLTRLWKLSPGGAPERPLEVPSASVIELRASSMPCPVCEGALRVMDHRANPGAGLRVVDCRCVTCGRAWSVYVRIAPPAIH